MKGTGASINLGSTTYDVDSAKLAVVKNAFISHLGTIAGNGYKVVVGGAEYNVDSAKMTGVMAELDAAWSGSISGDGDGGSSSVTYAATFADNDWATIAHACQNNAVPDTWQLAM